MLLFRKGLASRLPQLSPNFSSSAYRLFSTRPAQDNTSPSPSPSPASHFAVQYLIKSCGLSSDKAARASRYLLHLKSPKNPDAVLQFLRQAGVSELHIKAAVLRDSQFLCLSVEKSWQPRMAELQEIGFSSSDISFLLSITPHVFRYTNLKQKVLFWLGIFNSIEELLGVLKTDIFLLSINLETISANLSFLKDQCGLSACQIAQLIKLSPRLITSSPQVLKNKVKRAEKLGATHSSGMFLYALKVVNSLNQKIVDARMDNLRSLGFSHGEVTILVSKQPYVLTKPEAVMAHKMEFLTKKAGCDKLHLLNNPSLFTYSLEKRLVPRNIVRNILKLKGYPVTNQKVFSFMNQTEKQFVEKFVLPYEPDIPGFLQAYEGACAGNIQGLECFMSNSTLGN